MPGGSAAAAGLKAGDAILGFDGKPVKDITDLRLALLFKKEGDRATVRIKRIRRFAPDRVMTVEVGPFRKGHYRAGMMGSPHRR